MSELTPNESASKELLALARPGIILISANTVKRRIEGMHCLKKEEMKNLLDTIDSKVSFTTDCWTSPNNLAFMGITAHFIDKEWVLTQKTSAFTPWSDVGIQEKI